MSSKEYLYRKLRPELLEPESKRPGNMEKPRSIEPRFTLERDVVLSASAKQQLDEAIGKIRNHQTIYVDWGFGEVDPCGSGTLLNFHGAPGTGKTLSAEAFAGTGQADHHCQHCRFGKQVHGRHGEEHCAPVRGHTSGGRRAVSR
ncbi:hypothetical protein ACG3RN_01575 [Pseudomonas aeruginosa]